MNYNSTWEIENQDPGHVRKAVNFISESKKDNVVLLPKTVDFYQIKLTEMLETEQYREAVQLLEFLLQCQGEDRQTYEEWEVLFNWLQTSLANGELLDRSDFKQGDAEYETEEDVYREQIRLKADKDKQYTKKLLDMLLQDPSIDKKLLALTQITYIDHPHIDDTLIRWIEHVDLHPMVQFKVLQTLKIRGASGRIRFQRRGEIAEVDIEDTPARFEQFPEQVHHILSRVREKSESEHPALFYFAEQLWKDFLAYIYGSLMYYEMLQNGDEMIDAWAAALHTVSLQTIGENVDGEEVAEMYGITRDMRFRFDQARKILTGFASS
jgi:hypothetical protein